MWTLYQVTKAHGQRVHYNPSFFLFFFFFYIECVLTHSMTSISKADFELNMEDCLQHHSHDYLEGCWIPWLHEASG